MGDELTPLADAISALRRELRVAAAAAQDVDPSERFRITEAQIELTVVAEDSVSGGGELNWYIFKAKADTSSKNSQIHKVMLTLNLGDVEVGSHMHTR